MHVYVRTSSCMCPMPIHLCIGTVSFTCTLHIVYALVGKFTHLYIHCITACVVYLTFASGWFTPIGSITLRGAVLTAHQYVAQVALVLGCSTTCRVPERDRAMFQSRRFDTVCRPGRNEVCKLTACVRTMYVCK